MVEIELFKSKCCNAEAIMDFGNTLTDFVNDSGKKPGDITFPQVHTVSFVCSKCHKPCNTYDLTNQLKKIASKDDIIVLKVSKKKFDAHIKRICRGNIRQGCKICKPGNCPFYVYIKRRLAEL